MKLKKFLIIILIFVILLNVAPKKVHGVNKNFESYLNNYETVSFMQNSKVNKIIWRFRKIETIKKLINELKNSKIISKIKIKKYIGTNNVVKNIDRSLKIEDLTKQLETENAISLVENNNIEQIQNNTKNAIKMENNKAVTISKVKNLKTSESNPVINTVKQPENKQLSNQNQVDNNSSSAIQESNEKKSETKQSENSQTTTKPVETNTVTNTENQVKPAEPKTETNSVKKIQAPSGAKVGVDVSKFQGNIDWAKVKESGIEFAMIKCGARGYTQGSLSEDPNFKKNVIGASNAGIKVGVYFYSSALNEEEAIEEANYLIGKINNYGLKSKITYPVAFDFENDFAGTRNYNLTQEEGTNICKAFCNQIRNSGFKTMIYSHHYFLQTRLNMNSLQEYDTWMAQYLAKPTYPYKYTIWQYTSSGSVSGINGNVDLNYCYKNY